METQVNIKNIMCKNCGEKFKFNIALNKHLEKCHFKLIECETCCNIVEKSAYNEHLLSHKNGIYKYIDSTLKIKLSKLNGVECTKFKCFYICKICFKQFGVLSNLTEHIKTHDMNDGQIQCDDNSEYAPVNKLVDSIEQSRYESDRGCMEYNIRLDTKESMNLLFDNYSKRFQNIWNTLLDNVQDNLKIACCCMLCDTFFTSKDALLKHLDDYQKNKSCTKPDDSLDDQNVTFDNINQNIDTVNSQGINVIGNSSNQIDIVSETNSTSTEFENDSYDHMESDNSSDTEDTDNSSNESVVQNLAQNSNNYGSVNFVSYPSSSNNMFNNQYVIDDNINMENENGLDTNFSEINSETISINANDSIVQTNIEGNNLIPIDTHAPKNNVSANEWLCIICHKRYNRRSNLENHMKTHSSTTNTIITRSSNNIYKCQYCRKQFNRKVSYTFHMSTHNLNNKQVSDINNTNLSIVGDIKSEELQQKQNHKSSKSVPRSSSFIKLNSNPAQHRSRFECGNCKKKFNFKSLWKNHLSVNKVCRHHNNRCLKLKPIKTRNKYNKFTYFECRVCQKTFSSSLNCKNHLLKVHKLENSDTYINIVERKEKLETEAIKKNTKLLSEVKSGLIPNNNTVQCQFCSKIYGQKSHLNRHIKNIHLVVKKPFKKIYHLRKNVNDEN